MLNKLKEAFSGFAKTLRNNGLSERDIYVIEHKLEERLKEEPIPQIAIIGFTGVGKSSTLNALFNAGRPTDDVEPCTEAASAVIGNIEPYTGSKGVIKIFDMPGLGEDIEQDEEYYKIYEKIIPNVDVVIWAFHASDRAMTPMQQAISRLVKSLGTEFTKHLLFAINKADTVAPGESAWNIKFNVPSEQQSENLIKAENYIREKVKKVLPGWDGPVVAYSAKYRYHLEQLMTAMIEVMPEKRRWVLNSMTDLAPYLDLVDQEYREYILSLQNQNSES